MSPRRLALTSPSSQVAGIGRGANALQLNCASGLTDAQWWQPIESYEAAPLAGQIVTFQCKVQNNTGASITPTLTVKHLNASDVGVATPWTGGSPAASTADISAQALQACANSVTTTLTWAFTANAAFGNGAVVVLDFGGGLNAGSGDIVLGDFDISVTPFAAPGASNPSPPTPEIRALSTEIEICQRFMPNFNTPLEIGQQAGFAQCTSTGSAISLWRFPAPSRAFRLPAVQITAHDLTQATSGTVAGGR